MRILIAGDYVPQKRINEKLSMRDFSFFDSVREKLESVDYSIVNLEAPITDGTKLCPIDKTGPNLYANETALEALCYAGFRCVTLANNHFRDYGQHLVESTISLCEKWALDHIGGGSNAEQASRYSVIEDPDSKQKIAIINACEAEWSISNSHHGGSNPLDIVNICRDISSAKKRCAYCILIIHGGVEWYNLPTPRMQKLYRFFVEQGADVVINNHQHCFSGYEMYEGKPIIYGLGNFCFDKGKQRRSFWNEGVLVELDIDEDISISFVPLLQCADDSTVELLPDDDKILTELHNLSSVIADSCLLEDRFNEFSEKAALSRLSLLQPWQGRILGWLYGHGLLPDLLSHEWKKRALNLFRCESHREVLLNYLEKQVN